MKRIVVILICFIPLLGCDLLFGNGENFPPEPDIEHYTIIQNKSSHKIELHNYRYGQVSHSVVLGSDEIKKYYNEIFKEDVPYLPNATDSANVVFNNNISVWHTKEDVQDVSRSIWLRSSYTGGKVNDKLYEIYYEFTDADYEEAVVLNGGG